MNNRAENSKNELPEYSIGVVTYVARFEKFFMPLIKQLVEVFPDKEIVCIINGHYDAPLQIDYLKRITVFLNQFSNVHYITYEKHQPLAKCFNWLALMTFAPRILILNDDVSLNLLFRRDFEKNLKKNDSFFVINHSWCHFLISKNFVKEIGWFEERLLGTGQEDGDYQNRIWASGKQIAKVICHGIINYIAPQENAGWTDISAVSNGGKTSAVNDEFLDKKYSCDKDSGKCAVRQGMETPIFYDFSCLDDKEGSYAPEFSYKDRKPPLHCVLMLPFNAIYSYTRKTAGKMYRYAKKTFK